MPAFQERKQGKHVKAVPFESRLPGYAITRRIMEPSFTNPDQQGGNAPCQSHVY